MGLHQEQSTAPRPQIVRSRSYPSHAIRHVTYDGTMAHISTGSASPSAPAHSTRHGFEYFTDDLDEHPEQHFLSPKEMYDYDWDSDSGDDDGDDVELDAGILDFALFDSDRRRAEQLGESIPSRWNGLVANQVSALDRAKQRNRNDKPDEHTTSLNDRTPDLTPDNSPSLRDNLDNDRGIRQRNANRSTPSILVTPPGARASELEEEEDEDEDDDYRPLSYFIRRGSEQRMPNTQPTTPQRPGLKYNRTMSGKLHVWRRPSMEIYPLREEPAAEQNAELA